MEINNNLLGIDYINLAQKVKELGQPEFRAKQLWNWIYDHGAMDFSKMSNLPKSLIEQLEPYTLKRGEVVKELVSFDGTRKWLVRFADGNEVEVVLIPEQERNTLCISSQVGCTLSCSFCHTGTQALVRNLTGGEILSQVMLAKDHLSDWPSSKGEHKLTNIVLMGMGEPLLNYENVKIAVQIIIEAMNFSKRRITLSTSGIVPQIIKCGEELGVNLAISLHAVTNALRDVLVPINKKYPIEQLLAVCREYPGTSIERRITFEYVMLKGVNDTVTDAKTLVKMLKGIPAKVNIIPFNPWPNSPYQCSAPADIRTFARIIEDAGFSSPIRTPRGPDILAACGQLKSDSVRLKKAKA